MFFNGVMMKAALKEEQYLIFRVGLVACCVSIETIDSVVRAQFGELHQLPNQANYISGVLQHRGKIITVVNLFHKFAQTPPTDEPGDYILAHTKFGLAGFWVNEVLDIVNASEEEWGAAPHYLGDNIFHKTMLWQDKLILQSEFDHLVAMNDSDRINDWAMKNRSDLFEQDAANSLVHEDGLCDESGDVVSEHEHSERVVSLFEPTEHIALTDDRIDDEKSEVESEFTSIELPSEPNSDVELHAIEREVIAADAPVSDFEVVPDNSAVLSEDDIPETAVEESNVDVESVLVDNSHDETLIVPGFTRFMEESSILSDFEDNSDIIELSVEQAPESPKAAIIDKTDVVSKFTRSPTEILSIQTTFDESSLLHSDFEEADNISPDIVALEISEPEDESIVPLQAIGNTDDTKLAGKTDLVENESVIEKEREEESKKEKIRENTSSTVVGFAQRSEDLLTHSTQPTAESGHDISQIIDSYIADAEKTSLNAAMDEKREASIRKIIDRIEENTPLSDGKKKFRLVASVLIAASAVFFIQHYTAEDKILLASIPDSIELLDDSPLRLTTSSTGVIEVANLNNGPIIFKAEGLLPILPIPLTAGAKGLIGEGVIFPWRTHAVNEGDTLWDLSGHYLKDPFRYPELARWSNIENPDLIYPGDAIKYQDEYKVDVQSYQKIVTFR